LFFQNLEKLVRQPDAPNTTEILEVYQMCLLLGFRGRHGAAGHAELKAIREVVAEKIRRTRGTPGELAPSWMLDDVAAGPVRDTWVRRLAYTACACAVLAVVVYGLSAFLLSGRAAELASLASRVK
jgi:type VI secretion system protein ImpK